MDEKYDENPVAEDVDKENDRNIPTQFYFP
jgi:hypothetical protein